MAETAPPATPYPGSHLPARKEKFKYLIRWLAWAVQNPDKHSGVVIVLKSREQGTGKSTLGVVMLKIFRLH